MDKLEKAFELIRKGLKPEKVRKLLELSDYEFEMIEVAQKLFDFEGVAVKKSDENEMFERIRRRLPSYPAQRFRVRLVLGFVSLLFIASTVIGLAAYHSNPESPLYELKNTVSKLVSKISQNKQQEQKLLQRQIREYKEAIERAEKENRLESVRRLREKLVEKEALMKKRLERRENFETAEKDGKGTMPSKKDRPGKKMNHEKSIPAIKEPAGRKQTKGETTDTTSEIQCPRNDDGKGLIEFHDRDRAGRKN